MEDINPWEELCAEKRKTAALLVALEEARGFIANGLDLGYIRQPEPGTRESRCLRMIENVLRETK